MPGNAGTFAVVGLGAAAEEIVNATIRLIARRENRFI
jgi:hypothetical protein